MRLGWLLLGFGWFLLLGVWSSMPAGDSGLWTLFAEARFRGASWALLRDLLRILGTALLPFLALGVLCRLAFGGTGSVGRFVGFPVSLALSAGLAILVTGLGVGANWRAPAAVESLLPLLGCFIGAVLGGALVQPLGRMVPSIVARILLLTAGFGLGLVVLAATLLGGSPSPGPRAAIDTDEKRALIDELRRQSPLGLDPGERTVLELAPADLRALLAWGTLLVDDEARADVQAVANGLAWQASVRVPVGPAIRRHLSMQGELALASKEGLLQVERCALAVGGLQFAPWLCRSLLGSLHRAALTSRDFGPLTAALDWLTIDDSGLAARYTRPDLDPQSLRRLQLAFGPGRDVRAAVAEQFDLLRARAPDLARSEDRLGDLLQAAFELAARRSENGNPVAENQGVILALATILGHHEVATLAGIERPSDWEQIRRAFWPVTLRGRADWTRHFIVSAGLTQVSTALMSDAAGLLKEELDAAQGSGFSFGDLLADRAGTRFGELAMRSPESALALQRAIVRGWRVDDFMPSAEGLPEGLRDADFQRRYGGVGGPGYQALVVDIEGRIARLPVIDNPGSR